MRKSKGMICLIIVLAIVLAGLVGVVIFINDREQPPVTDTTGSPETSAPTTEPTAPPTTEPATQPTEPPIVKEATATISSVGDILMHKPVINTGYNSTTGGYDFASVFTYFQDYVTSSDLAIANLETTLAGTDNGYAYSGYPNFNCPDGIADSLKTAGFDLILTSNNHTYDTGSIGLARTLQVLQDRELQYLGTKPDAEAPDYVIVELNGIRIGMMCYTYETDGTADRKSLNGIPISQQDIPLINSFDYAHLDLFYTEMEENLAQMEALGADATMLFIHWGDEYRLAANDTQKEMAQALCDLGIDVIVGGHPHVVEPVELLTSTTDETQKTLCLYSMGNAVSNQRLGNLSSVKTAHTEDGVMFSVTFARYSDGTVILEDADILPTWVNMHYTADWQREYNILPLDTQIEDWKTQFDLTDETLQKALESYERTMAIVGEGMAEADAYYAAHQAEVEAQLGVEQ